MMERDNRRVLPWALARRCGRAALLLALAAWQAPAAAALIRTDLSLNLHTTADQSFWGPGRTAANFGSHDFFGGEALGISYDVKASTGTVDASFNGKVTTRYQDEIYRGERWRSSLRFDGVAGGGLIDTFIGAHANVTAHALGVDATLLNLDKSIAIDRSFQPTLDQVQNGSGQATAVAPGVGINIGIGSAKAGVDLNIVQNLSFVGKSVNGMLTATNGSSGHVIKTGVEIGVNGEADIVELNLGMEAGLWHLQLSGFTLDNDFATKFLLSLDPFVQYTVGTGCGNPGTNRDNGWFCIADDKSSFHAAGIDLFSSATFGLVFAPVELGAFDVLVLPEPGSALLLLAGAGGMALARRRRPSRGSAR